MDRIASLALRAQGLTRTLAASLPWGYRLATVFVRLVQANAQADVWGKMLGSIFLQAGVTDMPDPGPKWNPARPNPSSLPSGYLKREAIMAYQVALKKTGSPDAAEDVIQDAFMKAIEGGTKIKAMPLRSALSFFVTAVGWAADTRTLQRKKRKNDSLDKEDAEGNKVDLVDQVFEKNPYWYEDPDDYRMMGRLFTPSTWRNRVVPALSKIHEDMPLFFEQMIESPHTKMTDAVRNLPHYPQGKEHKGYVTWLNWLRGKVAPLLEDLAEEEGDGPALAHTASLNRLVTTSAGGVTVKAFVHRHACACQAPATVVESSSLEVPENVTLAGDIDRGVLVDGLIAHALETVDRTASAEAAGLWAATYTKLAGVAPGDREGWYGQATRLAFDGPEAHRPQAARLALAAVEQGEVFLARTRAATA